MSFPSLERNVALLAAAAFLGGAAEHGVWDREFYCRVQAVYGGDGP